MNSINIEDIEKYLEEIPDDGGDVSELEDFDEFDIAFPLDKEENVQEIDVQNIQCIESRPHSKCSYCKVYL